MLWVGFNWVGLWLDDEERKRKEEKRDKREDRREEVGQCHINITSVFNDYFNTV